MARKGKGMQGVKVGKPKRVPLPSPKIGVGMKPSDHGPRTRHHVTRSPNTKYRRRVLGD
jgi:hypothetical protein